MEWLQTNWVNVTALVGGVVTLASLIVKLTPSQEDDAMLAKIISVLNALALNPKQ